MLRVFRLSNVLRVWKCIVLGVYLKSAYICENLKQNMHLMYAIYGSFYNTDEY